MEKLRIIEYVGGFKDGRMKVLRPDEEDRKMISSGSFSDGGSTDVTPRYTYEYSHEETFTAIITKKFYKVTKVEPTENQ